MWTARGLWSWRRSCPRLKQNKTAQHGAVFKLLNLQSDYFFYLRHLFRRERASASGPVSQKFFNVRVGELGDSLLNGRYEFHYAFGQVFFKIAVAFACEFLFNILRREAGG